MRKSRSSLLGLDLLELRLLRRRRRLRDLEKLLRLRVREGFFFLVSSSAALSADALCAPATKASWMPILDCLKRLLDRLQLPRFSLL